MFSTLLFIVLVVMVMIADKQRISAIVNTAILIDSIRVHDNEPDATPQQRYHLFRQTGVRQLLPDYKYGIRKIPLGRQTAMDMILRLRDKESSKETIRDELLQLTE